jgi:hypothetical protein
MAYRTLVKLADIGGTISANALLTSELPKSGTYTGLVLNCLDGGVNETIANIIAEIDNIRLALNGTDLIDETPETLISLQSYYYGGLNAAEIAGILPLRFSQDYMPNNVAAEVFSLGMENISSAILEVEMAGTVSNVDQISIYAEKRDVRAPLGQHVRLKSFPRSFASTGTMEITDLPLEQNAATKAFHIEYDASGSCVLDEARIIVNDTEKVRLTPAIMQYLVEKAGRESQLDSTANAMFHIPFDLVNDLTGYLAHGGVSDLRIQLDWSGAAPGTFKVIRESIHGFSA